MDEELSQSPATDAMAAGIVALTDRRRAEALDCGALQPIKTHTEWIECDGLRFPVRWLDALERKAAAGVRGHANPFLPPDPRLTVDAAGPGHLLVLNKFPVMERHLLIVSRDFVAQSDPLQAADFDAVRPLLWAADGLCFYNGDRIAGASQPHRHLQWIPRDEALLPLLAPLEAAAERNEARCPALPYAHAIAALPAALWGEADGGRQLCECYRAMTDGFGLAGERRGAYNLLLTRRAMVLVPRSRESFAGISVNALGFAGSFFVPSPPLLDTVRRTTPPGVLARVGLAR